MNKIDETLLELSDGFITIEEAGAQLRDMVLAAVPAYVHSLHEETYRDGVADGRCDAAARIIANINALFDKENGNDSH